MAEPIELEPELRHLVIAANYNVFKEFEMRCKASRRPEYLGQPEQLAGRDPKNYVVWLCDGATKSPVFGSNEFLWFVGRGGTVRPDPVALEREVLRIQRNGL